MTTIPAGTYSITGDGGRIFFLLRNILVPALFVLGVAFVQLGLVISAIVIAGHVHVFMSYVAQARAGKMRRGYIIVASILVASCIAYFIISGAGFPLFLIASIMFAAHFAYDELTLHDEQWTPAKVTTFIGFVALFVALMIDMIFVVPGLLLLVAVVTALGIAARLFRGEPAPSRVEWYLWYLSVLIFLMLSGIIPVSLSSITGFIILLHFFNWMVGYGVKVHPVPKKRKRYWCETIFLFFMFTVLYILSTLVGLPVLAALLSVTAFYAWSIGHIVLSSYLIYTRSVS